METIAITGGTGFLGSHLVKNLLEKDDRIVRVLSRSPSPELLTISPRLEVWMGNLLDFETVRGFLPPGCLLVNLAYLDNGRGPNLKAAENLVKGCLGNGAKKVIHLSTVAVYGKIRDRIVTEETPCNPFTEYEKIKFELEEIIRNGLAGKIPLTILRPTAVFGSGGRNLKKLIDDISDGSKVKNYLKSCLFGRRHLNLVYIDNVISAIVFLINMPQNIRKEIFIVSDDDSKLNNYRDIEKYIIKRFGYKDYSFPRVPTSFLILSFLLRMYGKSNLNPNSIYDCSKILKKGFQKPISFDVGLDHFVDWYKGEFFSNRNK